MTPIVNAHNELYAMAKEGLVKAGLQKNLDKFIAESNRIEGINRPPTKGEIAATEHFLGMSDITVTDVKWLVKEYQPDARLRDLPGLDVQVGGYVAPRGGPDIETQLKDILARANRYRTIQKKHEPHAVHTMYELLHPFTDGNGRSGRTLWLWMMRGHAPLGFLHTFYYQTLSAAR